MLKLDYLLLKDLYIGKPSDFFWRNEAVIGKFIKRNKLKSVPVERLEVLQRIDLVASGAFDVRNIPDPTPINKRSPRKLRLPNIRGGIKGPHLHFKEKIYLLDEKKWNEFSKIIIKDIKGRLDKVQTISFQQALELSEAMEESGY